MDNIYGGKTARDTAANAAQNDKILSMSLSSTASGGLLEVGELSKVWNRDDDTKGMDAKIAQEVEEKYQFGKFLTFKDPELEEEFMQKYFYASIKTHRIFKLIIANALLAFIALILLEDGKMEIIYLYAAVALGSVGLIAYSYHKSYPLVQLYLLATFAIYIALSLGIARYYTDQEKDEEWQLTISDSHYLNIVFMCFQYGVLMALRFPVKVAYPTAAGIVIILLAIISEFPGITYMHYIVDIIFLLLGATPIVVTAWRFEKGNREQEIRRAGILRHTEEVVKEKLVTERLLLNILPNKIAKRLMTGEEVISDGYSSATVLFADLYEWNKIAKTLDPVDGIQLLNEIVSNFDRLTNVYKVEKIKTIGDAYLVACGLPDSMSPEESTRRMAAYALDLIRVVESLAMTKKLPIKITCGLHTGPVVAGVIGKTKFLYDLWGDSVNTASRMQSHGEPNRIHVTTTFYEYAKDHFEFEKLPEMTVKGKGIMQTYYLQSKKVQVTKSIESVEFKDGLPVSSNETGTNTGAPEQPKEVKNEEKEDTKESSAARKKRKAREALKKKNDELDVVIQTNIKAKHHLLQYFVDPIMEHDFQMMLEDFGQGRMHRYTIALILIQFFIGVDILNYDDSDSIVGFYYMLMGSCAIFQAMMIGVNHLFPAYGYLALVFVSVSQRVCLITVYIYYRMNHSIAMRFTYKAMVLFDLIMFMNSKMSYLHCGHVATGSFIFFSAISFFIERELTFDKHSLLMYGTLILIGGVTAKFVDGHMRRDFLMSKLAEEERKRVIKQREETERLLHNILPESVVQKNERV
eukprot:TRINITY_DN218_c1_g1_i3.p1 TRINITY_DN218_c1_g1~~TRINITY_DN218_c1_g1_i3.p1  ORF type:complete len:805 (-),score=174.15 TRINITY_DN218_c1_g1_i3:167-2581(-)